MTEFLCGMVVLWPSLWHTLFFCLWTRFRSKVTVLMLFGLLEPWQIDGLHSERTIHVVKSVHRTFKHLYNITHKQTIRIQMTICPIWGFTNPLGETFQPPSSSLLFTCGQSLYSSLYPVFIFALAHLLPVSSVMPCVFPPLLLACSASPGSCCILQQCFLPNPHTTAFPSAAPWELSSVPSHPLWQQQSRRVLRRAYLLLS